MTKTAIIVAGGSGTRLNTETPKQFIPLAGLPMLAYSLQAFHSYDPTMELILVLPDGFAAQWQELANAVHLDIPVKTVTGGHERFYSVSNALNAIQHKEGLVAIHDAARPFVSGQLIAEAFNYAAQNGCAVPALAVKDSLRVHSLDTWAVADRAHFRTIQTPQVFDLAKLKQAYRQPYIPAFTDDATVFERAGNKVYLIDGEEDNFKITTPRDLEFAQYLAEKRTGSIE